MFFISIYELIRRNALGILKLPSRIEVSKQIINILRYKVTYFFWNCKFFLQQSHSYPKVIVSGIIVLYFAFAKLKLIILR